MELIDLSCEKSVAAITPKWYVVYDVPAAQLQILRLTHNAVGKVDMER